MKKIITSLLFTMFIVFLQLGNVSAIFQDTIIVEQKGFETRHYGGQDYGMALQAANGSVVYCSHWDTPRNVVSQQCTLSDNWSAKIRYGVGKIISLAEADGSNNINTVTDAYFAANVAINVYLKETGGVSLEFTGNAIRGSGTSVGNLVNKYIAAANEYDDLETILTLSSNTTKLTFTKEDDGKYYSNIITLDYNVNPTTVVKVNGTRTGELKSVGDKKVQVVISSSSLQDGNNTVSVELENSREVYYARQYTCGSFQPVTLYEASPENKKLTLEGTIEIDVPQEVIIVKKDASGNNLAGAVLSLTCGTTKIAEWNTKDENPKSFKDLTIGAECIVEEVSAPAGYIKGASKTFTVGKNTTEPQVIEIVNTKDQKNTIIRIKKIDSKTKQGLAGAVLEIRDESGKNVVTGSDGNALRWTTDTGYKVFQNLPVGKYTVVEVRAPEGYVLNKQTISFEVKKDDETKSYEMDNNLNRIEIIKIDSETGEGLSGVELEIQDEKGNVVKGSDGKELKWTTDGKVKVIEKLKPGTYKLVETKPLDGYILESPIPFKVDNNGNLSVSRIEMKNKPNKIEITKVDSETGKDLSGIELEIQDEKGNVVKDADGKELKWTTDGKVKVINKLKPGTYKLVETKTLDGYILADPITFKVDNNGNPSKSKIEMVNEPTEVEINKVIEGKDILLSGAKLQVLNEEGEVIDEWISDDKPHIIKGLKYGKYTVVELEAPEGYELSKEKKEFVITADKQPEPVSYANTLMVPVPDTLSSRSTLLLCIAMFDIALGIGIVTYVKKNKVKE